MKLERSLCFVTLVVACSGLVSSTDAEAGSYLCYPTPEAIAFAERTSDLMTNTTVAALLQEIGETTPANVPEGSLSIGLIFDDLNHNLRLVGDIDPLSYNDYPEDAFEDAALTDALAGQPRTAVERINWKWYYRRSIPLSNFAPQCAMCHDAFQGMDASEYVGALMLRVPIPAN